MNREKIATALESLEAYRERHLVPAYFLNALADLRKALADNTPVIKHTKDPNAKLRDLITLVCDAAFACGECPERDDGQYKALFEAEHVAINNLTAYVNNIRLSTPLCPVHRGLEDTNTLECEIGNDCVACSLNERRALLGLIAEFAAEGNTEDSVTVWSRIVEFYKAHARDGRVIVSYPASAPSLSVRDPHCWHCGVVLADAPKLRCEDCPAECDTEGCEAFGCSPVSAAGGDEDDLSESVDSAVNFIEHYERDSVGEEGK